MPRDDLDEIINEIAAMEWKTRADQRQARRIIKLLENFKNEYEYKKIGVNG